MRIIAGRFKGKTLDAPKGTGTRPTSDRVRESLFNVLEHGAPDIRFEGLRVLDLFAGSGALGLEALSRGARYCLFIDDDTSARAAMRRTVEAMGLTGGTKIWRRDATKLGPAGNVTPFDIVFCDAPYGKGLGLRALDASATGGWLNRGAVAVVEDRAGAALEWPELFIELDRRRYGETEIAIAKLRD